MLQFHLPLPVLYMLASLSSDGATAREIRSRVAEYSNMRYRLSKWTFKKRIRSLRKMGWVQSEHRRVSPKDNEKRVRYRLLPQGELVLREQLEQLRKLIILGKEQLSVPAPLPATAERVIVDSSLPSGYWEKRSKRDQERRARILSKETMSPGEAAYVLHLSAPSIYRMLAAGELEGTLRSPRKREVTAASVRRRMQQKLLREETAQREEEYSVFRPDEAIDCNTALRPSAMARTLEGTQLHSEIKNTTEEKSSEGHPAIPRPAIYTLICLAGGPLNYAEIRNLLLEHSKGRLGINLGKRLVFMLKMGWIERDWIRRSLEHPLTIYYRLLPSGRRIVADQIAALEQSLMRMEGVPSRDTSS
jgi:DNA-binding PadR family transcriptional regulator